MDLWGSYKKGVLQAYTIINYVKRRKRGKIGETNGGGTSK